MIHEYLTHTEEETHALGRKLSEGLQPASVITLSGDLGAGKTTLAQGILEAFGAEGPYTSPTFVIMKEYALAEPKNSIRRVYHVDAYRVAAKDLENIGFEEWCSDPQGLVILEWPERAVEILPPRRIEVTLTQVNKERKIRVKEEPPRSQS